MAKATQLMECNALLSDRPYLDFEDLAALRYVLCDVGEQEELALFDSVATPLIEKFKQKRSQSVDELQLQMLQDITVSLPVIPSSSSAVSPADLVNLARRLVEIRLKVESIKPALGSTSDKQAALLRKVSAMEQKVDRMIKGQ
jgi:hypothetical protein